MSLFHLFRKIRLGAVLKVFCFNMERTEALGVHKGLKEAASKAVILVALQASDFYSNYIDFSQHVHFYQ